MPCPRVLGKLLVFEHSGADESRPAEREVVLVRRIRLVLAAAALTVVATTITPTSVFAVGTDPGTPGAGGSGSHYTSDGNTSTISGGEGHIGGGGGRHTINDGTSGASEQAGGYGDGINRTGAGGTCTIDPTGALRMLQGICV